MIFMHLETGELIEVVFFMTDETLSFDSGGDVPAYSIDRIGLKLQSHTKIENLYPENFSEKCDFIGFI